MRILVLGGTGFIGPDVVRQLVATGHEVAIIHSGAHEAELPEGVRHLHGSLERLAERGDEVAALQPEVALGMHLMTQAQAAAFVLTFRGLAHRSVVISSADVYRAYGRLHGTEPGPPEPVPLAKDAALRERLYPYRGATPRSQDDPRRWMDDYDKVLVERQAMADPELPATILRLGLVHGARSYRYFEYLKRMDDRRPAILLGEGSARFRGTRAYVEDVARAITLAVVDQRAAGRVYNVGESEPVAEADWVRMLGRVAGWEGEVAIMPPAQVPSDLAERLPRYLTGPDHGQDLVLETSGIRAELGYEERVPWYEGLARTIEWLRAHATDLTHPVLRDDHFDYAAEDALLARV